MAYLVCAGAYALNDYFDLPTDRVAKPSRPLASGALRPAAALVLGVALLVAAVLVAAFEGATVVAFCLGWVTSLLAYSWKLKGYGLLGNVVVSGVASSGFLLGGGVCGDFGAGVLPVAIAMTLHLGREIAKSVADVRGDRAVGMRTLAVRIGERRALVLSLWCIIGVAVVSLLPFILSVYGLGYFLTIAVGAYPILGLGVCRIIAAGRAGEDDGPAIAAAAGSVAGLLKLVMPVGLLAFFLEGV
jgi:geranylgeranylglycerol-phosphate geranylgeranyltransferase